jgi:TIR domain-containing protein
MASRTALTAFLSHKYKAPFINEFFFKLFSQVANVQFEVDLGTHATNVTQLERLIRDADAFIGIYSYDESVESDVPAADLLRNSRYFRLELDLASRARKPGILFVDKRYRGVFSAAPPIEQLVFNVQEIVGRGEKPSSAGYTVAFERFCNRVDAARNYDLAEGLVGKTTNCVGVLLPPSDRGSGYALEDSSIILKALQDARYEPVQLPWPPLVTPRFIEKIRELDWILLDVGPLSAESGIVGFLHGAFLPTMRLLRVPSQPDQDDLNPADALYAGVEVGYKKDIMRWWDSESLSSGLAKRLASLDGKRNRISTLDEALKYFASAALRKEAVFVSYAGADYDFAGNLRTAIRARFQEVFDYRDGQSIRPGQPWLKEIFDRLAVCPIGIPLLSPAYVQSGNCMHELRQMISQADQNQMALFPIKLRKDDSFTVPPELASFQYARLWEYSAATDLVEWVIANLKPATVVGS